MKRGFTFVILSFLVLMPIMTVSAQKSRTINRTQKVQKHSVQKTESEFSVTQAFSAGTGVYLNWRVSVEADIIGFLVYRVTPNGRELASQTLIPGSYLQTKQMTNDGTLYEFYDEKGDLNTNYVIESYSNSGKTMISAPFSTKEVADLAAIAGTSAEDFVKAAQNKTPILETNQTKLPKTLNNQRSASESLSNINTHRAVMTMPGVKIGVKKEGFYRVSRAELQAAGFDVNADSALWKLYLEGVELAINVGANGDYIEFLGKGIDEIESDTRNYNLVVGATNGKRMGVEVSRPQGNGVPATSYFNSYVRKERMTYAGGILNGDNQNYFGTFVGSTSGDVNFNLDSIDYLAGKSTMEITIQGLSQTSHQIQVVLNGETLNPIIGNSRESMVGTYSVPISLFRNGNNTLQMRNIVGSFTLVDSIKIEHFRFYRAVANQLSFYARGNRPSTVRGFTSPNIRVFNVNNPLEPRLVTNLEVVPEDGEYGVALLAGPERNLLAVEDTGLSSVASVVANAPSTLSTPANEANLVILSHGNFITQANAWANYRRGQGFDVDVINVEDIYDEFGFCVTSSNAIRSFLDYAKNNWQTPPQYVLMIGDSTYDARNYQGLGYFNFVPTKFVDTIYTEVPSDEALADFNDDGLSELAIGRIPVRTAQAATDALNKTIGFEINTANNMNRGALFASDLPNGYDFEDLSQRLADQLPASMPKSYINRAAPNAQSLLISDMNTGRFLVNYSGHGNAADWASSSFFSKANVPLLTNSSNLSVYVLLTCLNGYFVSPAITQEGLSERLLSSTVGGGVAVWSSTGLTTPDIQEVMATRFYQQIALGNIPRLGDLIKDAKTTINGGRDVRLSWGLLGDPMLKVR